MAHSVLIVEDEKPVSQVLEIKLSRNRIDVTTAFNGQEALDILAEKSFDLVLLDLLMPEVDGFTVLEEIRKKNWDMPVFITTNLSQDEDQEKARKLGANEYIVKSDTLLADIAQKVLHYLEQ